MARDITDWLPIEYDPSLVTEQVQHSAVLDVAVAKTMGSATMEMPRLLGANIGGGSVLLEDTTDGSKVTMYTYQYNNKVTLDEADTEDAYVDAINGYNAQFLNKLNVKHDNACLGVTGARSATATDYRPFTSLIKVLRTNDSDAGYTADANVLSGALTYDNLSNVLGLVEDSDFGDPTQLVVIAHRGLRNNLRKVKDDEGRPIFQSADAQVHSDSVFGIRIVWSAGAVEAPSFNASVSGAAKLLFVANRNTLINGKRIEPQARFIPAGINTTALEHTLQHRARRGFVVTVPQAAAALRVSA